MSPGGVRGSKRKQAPAAPCPDWLALFPQALHPRRRRPVLPTRETGILESSIPIETASSSLSAKRGQFRDEHCTAAAIPSAWLRRVSVGSWTRTSEYSRTVSSRTVSPLLDPSRRVPESGRRRTPPSVTQLPQVVNKQRMTPFPFVLTLFLLTHILNRFESGSRV